MPLMEHIRELRNRVFKALLIIAAGAIVGWYLYPHIWHFIETPYCRLDLSTHVQAPAGTARAASCSSPGSSTRSSSG